MSSSLLVPTQALSQALANAHRSLATPISASSRANMDRTLSHAWASSTRSKYQSGVDIFLRFCDSEGIPPILRLPASDDLLCAFASSKSGLVGASTVQGYLAALKAWHIVHNEPWLGSSRLRYFVNGVANLAPPSSSLPPRPPVTREMLILLACHLTVTTPLDACCFAAACMAFWAQLRLGEILSERQGSFSSSNTVCRSHLTGPLNANGSRKCHLPFTKVGKSRGEDVIICRQSDASDPIDALGIHLHINAPSPDIPLFSYRSGSDNSWKYLTRSTFLARCNTVWSSAGLPPFTGHSFRIGGTTEMLLAGVPPDVVKTLGRWSSDTFLKYWRSIDRIAPRHVEHLPKAS